MRADYEVLHLRSSAGLYGAEYVVLGLVTALAGLGIGGRLLCLDNQHLVEQPLWRRAEALGVPAQRLRCRARLDLGSVRALRTLLADSPRAILHVHDYKSAVYAWLARRRARPRIVATTHGQFADSARLRLYQGLETLLLPRFEAVCLVSARMQADLRLRGAAPRVHLIENGIDTTRFRADVAPLTRAGLAIPNDAIVFGTSMRLAEQKNPLGLVDAFARVLAVEPRALLAIAGDGPLRAALEQRVSALGIGARVRLLGARDDVERFYPLLDVFVLASHYEGLPLALLEAMAAERPIVATAVGQVPTVLAGVPAECVPADDGAALAAAMRRTLGRLGPQPQLRQRVLERYSLARMANDYALVYDSVWRGSHGNACA